LELADVNLENLDGMMVLTKVLKLDRAWLPIDH
jgi:hypothetical protein